MKFVYSFHSVELCGATCNKSIGYRCKRCQHKHLYSKRTIISAVTVPVLSIRVTKHSLTQSFEIVCVKSLNPTKQQYRNTGTKGRRHQTVPEGKLQATGRRNHCM